MKEGWFINYSKNPALVIEIPEHETWLRSGSNAGKLGVPAKVVEAFSKFEPIKDRDKFLLFVMKNAPIMRVRGHGQYVTFEFADSRNSDALDAVLEWGSRNAGAFTTLNILNLETGRQTEVLWKDFKLDMNSGGWQKVASRSVPREVCASIARELLAIARELGLK